VKFSVGVSAMSLSTPAGTMRILMMSVAKRNEIAVVAITAIDATISRSRSSPRCWTSDSSLSRSDIDVTLA